MAEKSPEGNRFSEDESDLVMQAVDAYVTYRQQVDPESRDSFLRNHQHLRIFLEPLFDIGFEEFCSSRVQPRDDLPAADGDTLEVAKLERSLADERAATAGSSPFRAA